MSDLKTFLLARMDEDALTATAALNNRTALAGWDESYVAPGEDEYIAAHIGRWQPSRVLAECEAKRRIVEECDYYERNPLVSDNLSVRVLALLALPYVDHPDYDESWRP